MTQKKNPWMKFYPQDWRSDEKLRMCSIGARGLWVEMLCIMHRSERYGHLLVSGKVPNDNALSVLVGVSPDQLAGLLAELESAEVYSRNGAGVIYSRRMVKDYRRSNTGKKNVKKRWNKQKSDADQSTDPVDKNPDGNRGANRGPSTKKPEARSQNKEKNTKKESGYAWEGQIIKINIDDYQGWRQQYGGTHEQFMDYLASRDGWYQDQPPQVKKNWYLATAKDIQRIAEVMT